jgi:ATP synthase protein I
MDEPRPTDPLKDLGARIDKAYGDRRPAASGNGRADGAGNALAVGMRIGLELVVGVAVGVGLGWAADHWLGTRPWGTVAGFFLGTAAGLVNVYRAVTGIGMAVGYRDTGSRKPRETDAEWDEE